MSQKSVSLFEVLPPSGGKKEEAPRPSGKATPQPTRPSQVAQNDPATGGRTRIEDIPKPPRPSMAAPEEPSHQSHDLEDISVRKKDDNHTFIFVCLLILPVVTYLAGHSVGKTKGIAIAMAFQQSQSKPTAITSSRKPVVQPTTTRTTRTTRTGIPDKPDPRASSILPTTLKTLTPAQARAAAPLTPPKMYSLQIQTFGPNQRKSIDELINALKAAGYDAFANYRNGAVFVGRLESSRGPVVEQLKNDIARFNWRKRDFSSTFAYKIPSHLLEK